MPNRYRPIDLSKLKVTSLEDRDSKVRQSDLGASSPKGVSFSRWFDALPQQLAGASLRELVARTAAAIRAGRPILLGMGGHVIKVGLAPLVCDLVREGFVTAVVSNGSVTIHDVELALVGKTSEDVDVALQDGTFGMSGRTADFILSAIARGRSRGAGAALGSALNEAEAPFAQTSVLATCDRAGAPMSVCIAIGTDIIHAHPQADGAALGEASLVDFRILCSVVADLLDGGVYLNFGSAVILPEVFLKAVSAARNLGYGGDFTTADFDFIRQYRPIDQRRAPPAPGDERQRLFVHRPSRVACSRFSGKASVKRSNEPPEHRRSALQRRGKRRRVARAASRRSRQGLVGRGIDDYEIVCVNDGSSDGTLRALRRVAHRLSQARDRVALAQLRPPIGRDGGHRRKRAATRSFSWTATCKIRPS